MPYYITDVESPNSITYRAEPLERGFATTLGNSLRRVLMSSIPGSAVIAVRIDDVDHMFSPIPGVKEDFFEVILNLKNMAVGLKSGVNNIKAHININGPMTVTAGMLQAEGGSLNESGSSEQVLVIPNPDHIICHVDKKTNLRISVIIAKGSGYKTSDAIQIPNYADASSGRYIPIDAVFSPIKSCSYSVEGRRVGSDTTYDSLILSVHTNGTITPDIAISYAARILQEQLKIFAGDYKTEEKENIENNDLPFDPKLLTKVAHLELSVRSHNCLKNENIIYVGDLVTKSEVKMLHTPNFGKKSLNEIKEVLNKMGISFGMDVPQWPPKNLKELSEKYDDHLNGGGESF